MIDDNLPMSPTAGSLINVYDQNFNGLGTTVELFNKQFEDERITRSKGKEVLNFSALSTSNIYQYLQTENIVEFGGRWFRIKYAEDDTSTKGLTHYDCYALWYELAEGTPTPLNEVGSTIRAVANTILEPFGKWVEIVIPTELQNRSVNSITLQENSALYKLRYLAKRFNLELTFGYREVIEKELRYVKTVVFLQQYTESKIEFPLVVEENLKHIARTEDSRNLVTAYKISGKSENDEEEFTFAEINGGSDYLVDTSWFTSRGMRPRIIPKAKKDDRYTIKQSMLDAARSYLDIYAKPLVSYEASAILYEEIPNLHQSQLVIDDTYSIVEWRKVSSRKLNYDDLTSSIIVFDDPRQDLMDLLNDDGDGALSPTEESDSRTIIRYANDARGNGFNETSGAYIGVLVTKKKVSELGPQDFSWHKIKGEEGPQGPPGRDGVDGIAGKDGVGIIETQVTYYLSTSGTTKPQTGWTEDVPPLVKGRYLWTRTIWRYSDGQLETGYSVAYVGQDGNNGTNGIAGKDGVGITSTSITYARSTSGTSAPTSGWTSSVPTVPAGEFLWTKTVWTYTDNTSETGYSVAKMGNTGAKGEKGDPGNDGLPGAPGVGIQSTTSTYGLSANETTQPATWSSSVPTLVKGQYLWTKNVWTYTDGKTETGYTKTYIAKDGNNGTNGIAGKDGVGISSTSITYAASSSGTTAPTSGWTTSVPNVSQGQYLWTKTVWNYTDNTNETGYSVARIGADGTGVANATNFYLASNQSTDIEKPADVFNLIRNGAYPTNTWYWSGAMIVSQHNLYYEGQKKLFLLQTAGTNEVLASSTRFAVKRNTNYTLSFYAFAGPNVRNSDVYFLGRKSNETNDFTSVNPLIYERRFSGSRVEYVTVTFNSGDNDNGYIRFDNNGSTDGINAVLFFGEVMLIEGKESKPWVASILDSGWTTTPQQISYAKRFLWNYRIELYTDGTTKATEPAVIGVYGEKGDQGIPGDKGADGKTQYTHIAYADNETGGGFSQTDRTKAYIGMYQDFTATDSTNPTSYKWTKWKGSDGAQGIPGPKGADGQTPYIHFAYSDNADGTVLTLSDNGQRYMGHYSDYTQADSTDKTKYRWADRWGKIDSGGRNYFKDSRSRTYTINSDTTQDYRTFIYDEFWKNDKRFIKSMVRISLDVAFSPALPNDISTMVHFSATPWYRAPITFKGGTTERQHFDLVYDFSGASSSYKTDNIFIRFTNSFPLNTIVSIENANLYISTVREDYRQAVEELEAALDSKADQALTDQQLNLLIEKAQLMETELKARAAMETLSDLERAYNAYVEANDKAVAKSEADLIEAGRRVDAVVETLGGLSKTKKFIDTYIKEAEEGIIIGTNDNVSQIRVTYDRIAMYSAGKEVMYISQGVINIDNGVFTKSLQIGRFRTEQHPTNLDINVCRYVG